MAASGIVIAGTALLSYLAANAYSYLMQNQDLNELLFFDGKEAVRNEIRQYEMELSRKPAAVRMFYNVYCEGISLANREFMKRL